MGTKGADIRRRVAAVVRNPWFKAIATLTVLVFVLFWLREQTPFFAEGFEAVTNPNWWWIAVSLIFSYLSMSSYGSVQKILLGSAGVRVRHMESTGLVFAANAFSTSIPGGQVFGTTLTYRKTRQWGATRVVASWQLVISGVLATVGIVLLALLGFFLVGTVSNPFLLTLSAIGLVAIVVVIQWAARHPDRIEGVLLSLLAWINARRRRPSDHGAVGVRKVVEQAEAVDMSKTQLSKAFAFSLLNWVADVGCLWGAANAVGAEHSIGGLCIAYVTGKIVATAPVTPGGLGTVEIALITALTAGGLGADQAFATVFIYRIVSFVLVALAGWVIFFLFYRGAVAIDPDEGEQPGTTDEAREESASGEASEAGTSGTSSSSWSPQGPGEGVPASSVGTSAMWPLRGDQWRPTVPHGSGPMPARRRGGAGAGDGTTGPGGAEFDDDEKGR